MSVASLLLIYLHQNKPPHKVEIFTIFIVWICHFSWNRIPRDRICIHCVRVSENEHDDPDHDLTHELFYKFNVPWKWKINLLSNLTWCWTQWNAVAVWTGLSYPARLMQHSKHSALIEYSQHIMINWHTLHTDANAKCPIEERTSPEISTVISCMNKLAIDILARQTSQT